MQHLVVALGLAREPDDERRPERGVGLLGADLADRGEEPLAAPPPLHAAQQARRTRAAARGRSTARPCRARASSTPAGRAPRTDRGRAAGCASRPDAGERVEPAQQRRRARPARRCRARTTRGPARRARAPHTPCSTSARASASIDSGVRERCVPRNDGIAQNAHARSHPSAIFTYAHGADGAGRGSSRRSRTPVGFFFSTTLGEIALAREPDDRVGFGQRGRELVAVALGHATGEHELGAGRASRRRARARRRSTPGGPTR